MPDRQPRWAHLSDEEVARDAELIRAKASQVGQPHWTGGPITEQEWSLLAEHMTRANLWGSHITVEDEVASRFIEHRLRFVPDEDRPSEFMIQQIIELYHEYLETLGLVTKDNGP